jgi:hypothetical protein
VRLALVLLHNSFTCCQSNDYPFSNELNVYTVVARYKCNRDNELNVYTVVARYKCNRDSHRFEGQIAI